MVRPSDLLASSAEVSADLFRSGAAELIGPPRYERIQEIYECHSQSFLISIVYVYLGVVMNHDPNALFTV